MGQLREGLGILFFLLVRVAAFMLAVAHALAHVTLESGMMTGAGSGLVARVLWRFALGLPAYSSFLVLTRAFYALGDVRTPALINAGTIATASIVGAVLFLLLGDAWAVPGLAAGHSVAFTVGAVVLALRLGSRAGPIASPALRSALGSSMLFGFAGLAAMAGARLLLPDATRAQAILSVLATGALGAAVYVAGMRASASPQLGRLAALARGVV